MNRVPPFLLHQPPGVDAALEILGQWRDSASVIMGGTELLPLMKLGLASVDHLVDCSSLTNDLRMEADDLIIGSAVTHRRLEKDPLVASALPALADLERTLANVRVRNVGTIGGNICFAEPRSDPATLLVALGATVEIASHSGRRSVDLEDFYLGPFSTVLDPFELLTEIRVPLPSADDKIGFRRMAVGERPAANVAFKISPESVRIAVGAVGLKVTRAQQAEEILASGGPGAVATAAEAASAEVPALSDVDGSDGFKQHLVEVLLRRSLASVLEGSE